MFPEQLPPQWKRSLRSEAQKPYFKALSSFLKKEINSKHEIYPAQENVLRALEEIDLPLVKVVILGQDPYHGPGQAVGRSFAVPNEHFPKPPSLKNIFKEVQSDLKVELDSSQSDLSGWARQGVLLLNTVLTVRKSQAFSHREKGWETFTDKVIETLNAREKPIIFLLWGSPARSKKKLITQPQHCILESPHPSPLSAHRGFFGSSPFSKTNALLIEQGLSPIDWAKIS